MEQVSMCVVGQMEVAAVLAGKGMLKEDGWRG